MKSQLKRLTSIQLAFKNSLLKQDSKYLNRKISAQKVSDANIRIGAYQYAYWARLLDVVSEDYPLTKKYLGEKLFNAIVKLYALNSPSKTYNINSYSLEFPKYCVQKLPIYKIQFAKELLMYEMLVVECFYSSNSSEKISFQTISNQDQNNVERAVLKLNKSVVLCEFKYDIIKYKNSKLKPEKTNSYLMIYRNEFIPCVISFSQNQYKILKLIENNKSFKQIANACPKSDMVHLYDWFAQWMSLGIFESLEIKK